MMKFKKVMAAVIACVFAFGLMGALAGCGDNGKKDEQAIRQSIDEFMTAIKDPTTAEAQEVLGGIDQADLAEFEQYGIDGLDFIKNCFSPVTWNTDSVKVDGKKAEATVTVTNVNLTAAMEQAAGELQAWAETPDAYTAMMSASDPMKAAMGKFVEFFYADITTTSEKVTTPVTLKFEKNGDTWELSNDTDINAFVSALYGGMDVDSVL